VLQSDLVTSRQTLVVFSQIEHVARTLPRGGDVADMLAARIPVLADIVAKVFWVAKENL
jgi:hypothetical protein